MSARRALTTVLPIAALLAVGLACSGGTEAPETPETPRGKRGKGPGKAKPDAFAMTGPATPAPEGAPNVLVVVWDTTRADHLSAYGYDKPTTPRLETFAAEGVLFERAVSPGMWTLPSHASMFTGLPVTAHGAYPGHKILDAEFDTFAEHFRAHGYDTYLFSANPYLGDHTQLGQGFDTREYPWSPAWKAKAKAVTMGKLMDGDRSNSLAPDWQPSKYEAGRGNDKVKDAGPVTTEALVTWVESRPDADKPWLAFLNYMETHVPRVPSKAAREALFSPEEIEAQLTLDQSFGYLLAHTMNLYDFTPEQVGVIANTYDATIVDLDAATGVLIDALSTRGWLDDTIVVITADHGEHLGEHHRIGHKFSVYNPLVRVPLVIRYPKRLEPQRVKEVVSNLGIFATLTDLAGLPTPEGLMVGSLVDPANRTGVAFSELAKPTPQAFIRMGKVHPEFKGEARTPYEHTYASVEAPDAKCIARGDGARMLFEMPTDLLETTDLASADPERTGAVCGLIDAWRGSFTPYGGSTVEPEVTSDDPELRARLEALGYLQDEEGE